MLADAMLAGLPPAVQAEREATGRSTLAACPGAAEVFISALMSWEYLATGWADPGLAGIPVDPAQMVTYNNRGWGVYYSSEPPIVQVGGKSYLMKGWIHTSPLILDLDGDGAPSVPGGDSSPHRGMDLVGPFAAFDIDGDGFTDLSEWLLPGDGILVAPDDPAAVAPGPDGLTWSGPLSGRDLLGTAGGYRDGFEKLLDLFDLNGDRIIEGPELLGLYLWRDLSAEGTIEPGELVLPGDLGITALLPPSAGACVGSFIGELGPRAMWDWWPSYTRITPVWQGGVEPPASVMLTETTLPDLSFTGPFLPMGPGGWISSHDLASAGLDFPSVRLVGLSPDGEWLVLHDRNPDPARTSAGDIRRLWVLPASATSTAITPRIVPLPAFDILQVVFGDTGTAFLVADNGTALFRLDLDTGTLALLYRTRTGQPGFRFQDYAFRSGGEVHFSGYFHGADQESPRDVTASIGGAAQSGYSPLDDSLVQSGDRDQMLATVRTLGTIAGECPAGPDFSHFVVKTPAEESLLATYRQGFLLVGDSGVLPNGLAASGNRVLYFRESLDPGSPDSPQVCVFDASTGQIWVLGGGDFCYPFLAAGGTKAFVAGIDWATGAMTIWDAPVAEGALLQPVLGAPGVGAVRVAENGKSLVYLGPGGLCLGAASPAGTPGPAPSPLRFLRNHPNPFNTSTVISFETQAPCRIDLRVFDAAGRLVQVLMDGVAVEGAGQALWRGLDASGRAVPSGIYYYRLLTDGFEQTRPMALIK